MISPSRKEKTRCQKPDKISIEDLKVISKPSKLVTTPKKISTSLQKITTKNYKETPKVKHLDQKQLNCMNYFLNFKKAQTDSPLEEIRESKHD